MAASDTPETLSAEAIANGWTPEVEAAFNADQAREDEAFLADLEAYPETIAAHYPDDYWTPSQTQRQDERFYALLLLTAGNALNAGCGDDDLDGALERVAWLAAPDHMRMGELRETVANARREALAR